MKCAITDCQSGIQTNSSEAEAFLAEELRSEFVAIEVRRWVHGIQDFLGIEVASGADFVHDVFQGLLDAHSLL